MMNKELLELCKAYATGKISWQQYRKLRRELIDSILELDNDDTLPIKQYIRK
jgi:hypothetical protein